MASSDALMQLMKMVGNNVKVTIDDNEMIFSEMIIKQTKDGGTVVMVDGIPAFSDDVKINIEVNGDVEFIVLGSGTINCINVKNGIKTVSGDVYCENVTGNITSTSGNVNCDDVSGNVSTVSGNVTCEDISGNVSTVTGDIN